MEFGELILGTAQLGMQYGRVNRIGKPSRQDAVRIVRHAIANGVAAIDTARAYGEAEEVIGEALLDCSPARPTVITKLDLSSALATACELEMHERVDRSIDDSCCALRVDWLDVALLHNWSRRKMWNGAAWNRLLEQKKSGRVKALGVSVYFPNEALEALHEPDLTHLQLPMNVLDWRWAQVALASVARPDVFISARSVLLQGILVHPPELWPGIASFEGEECVQKLWMLVRKFEREGLADLCLAYVRSLPWINGVIVGCETLRQLDQNLELFQTPKLKPEQIEELERTLPRAPEVLLNPSMWDQRIEATVAG